MESKRLRHDAGSVRLRNLVLRGPRRELRPTLVSLADDLRDGTVKIPSYNASRQEASRFLFLLAGALTTFARDNDTIGLRDLHEAYTKSLIYSFGTIDYDLAIEYAKDQLYIGANFADALAERPGYSERRIARFFVESFNYQPPGTV